MGDTGSSAHLHAWEHSYIQAGTLSLERSTRALNDLGIQGWELVPTRRAEKTLGFNSVAAFLRRRIVPLAAPPLPNPGWYADPSGRHQHRLWNGQSWTCQVADEGERLRDPPTRLTPTPGPHQ